MPVQSEYYDKIKPVCDRLAVLASQCHEKEFEKRFDLLEALCKSWSHSGVQQKLPPAVDVIQANGEDSQHSEHSSSDCFTAEETVNANRPLHSDHAEGEVALIAFIEIIAVLIFSVFGGFCQQLHTYILHNIFILVPLCQWQWFIVHICCMEVVDYTVVIDM